MSGTVYRTIRDLVFIGIKSVVRKAYGHFLRAGKVSIEATLEACLQALVKCERAHDRATLSRGAGARSEAASAQNKFNERKEKQHE